MDTVQIVSGKEDVHLLCGSCMLDVTTASWHYITQSSSSVVTVCDATEGDIVYPEPGNRIKGTKVTCNTDCSLTLHNITWAAEGTYCCEGHTGTKIVCYNIYMSGTNV